MYRVFVTLTDARTNRNGPTKAYRDELRGTIHLAAFAYVKEGTRLGRRGVYIEAFAAKDIRLALESLVRWATTKRALVTVHAEYLNAATLRIAESMILVSPAVSRAEEARQKRSGSWSGPRDQVEI